jgi:hypothetical protein
MTPQIRPRRTIKNVLSERLDYRIPCTALKFLADTWIGKETLLCAVRVIYVFHRGLDFALWGTGVRRTASVDLGAEEFGIRTCKRVGLKLVGGMISSAGGQRRDSRLDQGACQTRCI